MARHSGNEGVVKVGGVAVAAVNSFDFNDEIEVIQSRGMGERWMTSAATGGGWTGTLSCDLDEADAAQTALAVGSEVALELFTDGDAAGKTENAGNAIITARGVAVDKGAFVTVTFQFTGNGALTKTVVA